MGKIRKSPNILVNEISTLSSYLDYIDNNRFNLTNERADAASIEYTGDPNNPVDLDNLNELQYYGLQVDSDTLIKKAQKEYLDNIEQQQIIDAQNDILKKQDEAFAKTDADYFQEELGNSTLYTQKLAMDMVAKASDGYEYNDFEKVINNAGYSFTSVIDDIGAFFTAPLSARLPTFKSFGLTDTVANPFYSVNAVAEAVNLKLDDIKVKKSTNPDSLSFLESVAGFFIDNTVSNSFKDKASLNRSIANTYKLSDKTISENGWDAVNDPNYWVDLVANGLPTAVGFMAGGGAVAKSGKLAGLSNEANTLLTALALTSMEGTQIGTDVANRVLRDTLDKHTDGQFSNSESFAIKNAMQTALQNSPNLTKQELTTLEHDVKNEHLKKFLKDNPDAAKQSLTAAQTGYTQATAVNNANILFNLTGAGLLTKGFRQELAKAPLKEILITTARESSQEFIEEAVTNNLAEKSGISVGLTGKYSSSDLTKDLFSLEALEQGIAGAVTGGLFGGGMTALNYKTIKDNYVKQQDVINKYNNIASKNIISDDLLLSTASTLNRAETVKTLLGDYALAKSSNSESTVKAIESLILSEQVLSSIQSNTLPQLKGLYKKISENTNNSAEIKQAAVESLSTINNIESKVNKYYNYKNTSEIVSKEVLKEQLDLEIGKLNNNLNTSISVLSTSLNSINPELGLNTIDPNINPYEDIDSNLYKEYNNFLQLDSTKNILKEYNANKDELSGIKELHTNTVTNLATIKSKDHQKYLNDKENLVIKLKSIKNSFVNKAVKALSIDKNINSDEAFAKINDANIPKSKLEYNNKIDEVINSYSKSKAKSIISQNELTEIANLFKFSDNLNQSTQETINNTAESAVLNNTNNDKKTIVDISNPESVDLTTNISSIEPVDLTDAVNSIEPNNFTDSSIEPTDLTISTDVITNNKTTENSNIQLDAEINDLKNSDDVKESISTAIASNEIVSNSFNTLLDNINSNFIELSNHKQSIEVQIEYFKTELNNGHDATINEILNLKLDKLNSILNDINSNIAKLNEIRNELNKITDNDINNNSVEKLNKELENTLNVVPEELAPIELTNEQKSNVDRILSLLGDTRNTIEESVQDDNINGKVVTSTNDESSMVRIHSIPYSKMKIVSSINSIFNSITAAYNNFISYIDNPNNQVLNTVLSYEIDTEILNIFKNSNIQLNKDKGNRIGGAALFNFINTGTYYYNSVLSDDLILAIPIKVKIDDTSYTYLVDNGYFLNTSQNSDGNYVFDDGRILHPSEFAKYKERVIAERRFIVESIMRGVTPQSIIIQKDYGLPIRSKEFNIINTLSDYNNNMDMFIVKADGNLDGNGVTTTDILKTHKIKSGSVVISTNATTGDKIAENAQHNKLSNREASIVLEAIKLILNNKDSINDYATIQIGNKIEVSGIKPLSIIDLILDLGEINHISDPIFNKELNIISDYLKSGDNYAINYLKTKYSNSNLVGINKTILNAVNNINNEKLNNKTVNPIESGAIFMEFNANSNYNEVLASRMLTNLTKFQREKSNIVTKLLNTPINNDSNIELNDNQAFPILLEEIDNFWTTSNDELAFSLTSNFTELIEDETINNQKEWLKNNLPQIPVEEYDTLLKISNDSIALGYFFTALELVANEITPKFGIKYSRYQPVNLNERGIIYHEAFHSVVRLMLTEKEYNNLIKIADEETLAEAFRKYMITGIEFSDTTVQTLFDRILNYILSLLGISNEQKVNKLFKNIATGKYKNNAIINNRIQNFGINYSSLNTTVDLFTAKEAAKSIVMSALDNSNLEVVEKLTNEDIQKIINATKNIYISTIGTDNENAKAFMKFALNFNSIRYNQKIEQDGSISKTENELNIITVEANKFLKNIIKEDFKNDSDDYMSTDLTDNTDTDYNKSEDIDENISKHVVDSSLIDYELKAPKFVKVLLASIPKQDNNKQYVFNKYTGLREAVDFKSQYTILLNLLSGMVNDILVDPSIEMTKNNLGYTKVLNRLNEISKFKPEYKQLYNYLMSGSDELQFKKQSMFYNAFALNRTDYLTVNINTEIQSRIDDTNTEIEIINKKISMFETTSADVPFSIVKKWAGLSDIINKLTTLKNNILTYNIETIAAIKNNRDSTLVKLEKIDKEFKKENSKIITQEEKNKMYLDGLNAVIDFFKSAYNIDINPNAINLLIYDKLTKDGLTGIIENNNGLNFNKNAFNQLYGIFKNSTYDFDNTNNFGIIKLALSGKTPNLKNIFKSFKTSLNSLAAYQYIFEDTVSNAMIKGPDNKSIFLFDYQSHINSMFTFLSSNTIESKKYIDTLTSKIEHSNSLYINDIANKKIKLTRLLSLDDNAKKISRSGTQIDIKNDLLMNIHTSLNSVQNSNYKSYVRMLSFADKSTSDLFYSMSNSSIINPIKDNYADGNVEVNENTVDIFYKYMLSELERIFYKDTIDDININKNRNNLYLFPQFSPSNANVNEIAKYIESVGKIIKPNTNIYDAMKPMEETIKQAIKQELETFISNEIQYYTNAGITISDIMPELASKFSGNNKLNNIIAQSSINGIIANIETTKIFTGSVAGYSSKDSFLKRTPFITIKGYTYTTTDLNKHKFNLAVLKTEKIESTLYTDSVVESFRTILEKTYQEYITEKKLNKTVGDFKPIIDKRLEALKKAYSELDITDAQGYITLDRWYDLMKGLGRDTASTKELYNKLKNGTATFEDHYKAQQFLQPLKGVIHELNINNSRFAKPINIKYSSFILTPQLVKNSKKLQELYDKMMNQNIDEVVFDTASKGDMNHSNNVNDYKFKYIDLNKTSWKLQVDFNAKNYKDNTTKVSTQAIKNIRSNVRPNTIYSNGITGKTIIKTLNKLESTLINRRAEKFYTNTTLQSIADNLDITDVQKAALKNIPISTLPQLFNAVEHSLNSAIKKNITELKLNGGAFIQTSPEFFTVDVNDSNIRWFIDKKELTGSTLDKSAYILLPYNIVKDLTDEQLQNINIDPRILEGIGLRIPNQPKSSIDKIKIAGFLPRGYGDTVIVYNEGTKKFGYDFDIDKKYIILPDVKHDKETNTVSYVVPPTDNKNYYVWSNSEIRNKILELWQVLINEHFDEIVEPLDNNWLRDLIVKHGADLNTADGLKFFSTSYQLEIKRNNTLAKFLIGPLANFTSDIAANQAAKLYIPQKLGIGNTTKEGFIDLSQSFDNEGNLITNTGLQYQNASIDAAKDPYIISGNINDYTVGVAVFLIKAGVDRNFPIQLLSQPILKEYSKLRSSGISHRDSIKSLSNSNYEYYNKLPLDVAVKQLISNFNSDSITNDGLSLHVYDMLSSLADLDTKQTLATKIDVNGGGKTFVDKYVLKENIREILKLNTSEFNLFNDVILGKIPLNNKLVNLFNSKTEIKNFIFKFIDLNSNSNGSSTSLTTLGTHYKNEVLMLNEKFSDDVLMFSSSFNEFAYKVSNLLGKQYLINNNIVRQLYTSFYNYTIKSSFNNNISTFKSKLDSDNGLATKIRNFSTAEPNFKINTFISNIYFTTDKLNNFTFINIDNKKAKNLKDAIITDFSKMLNGEYGNTGIEIANELIEYAVQSSVTYNQKSFFDYIPATAFSNTTNTDIDQYKLIEQLYRHNVDNDNIVKPMYGKRKYKGNFIVASIQKSNNVILPFVSANIKNKITNTVEKRLFQLKSYNTVNDTAIYQLTYSQGYNTEFGVFNEYGDFTDNTIVIQNKVQDIPDVNRELLDVQADNKYIINFPTSRKFQSELIYSMAGTGKTTIVDTNPLIVEPEPVYKKLLNNNSILEGIKAVTNNYKNMAALEPIHDAVADWVKEQLNLGYTVVSGLSFLAENPTKYDLTFSHAVILDNVNTFIERVSKRENNPIELFKSDVLAAITGEIKPEFDVKSYENLYERYKNIAVSLGINVVSLSKDQYLDNYLNSKIDQLKPDSNLNSIIKKSCE